MEQKKPTSSLIISTYNWPEALSLSLKSVLAQKILPNEVIIADDGSTEETKCIIDSFRSIFPVPLKHVWHEDKGFRKTIILNKAVAEASGEYIIQIDGDVILDANFVEDHLRVAESKTFIRGTRAHLTKEVIPAVFETKRVDFSFLSKGVKHRFNALRLPRMAWLFTRKRSCSKSVRGCNLAYWKRDFVRINGYNNMLEGWGHEDEEMASRLINIGIKKKRLKLMAIQYHIYHPVASKMHENRHLRLLNQSLFEKLKRCENGYFESLQHEKVSVLEFSQY
ncbi:glycosyltransferase family 2 protein [Olivibacter sp. LS-1]|uniref:glycosyltransferase family 2 protein n=1 Tax=Olivibacter TaxID=376469 RepID=UPI0011EB1D27|nr:glycosyltransferase family 2 protein [Olivibacter sp. LS-1]QEL00973.1 glycosyltransferase [Olivibacter sp. LS-1]